MEKADDTNAALAAAGLYFVEREKLKLKDVAAECGCSPRHLGGVLNSSDTRRNMSARLATRLAQKFRLSYEHFLLLGEWILAGRPVTEDVLLSLRTLSSRDNPELRHLTGPSLRMSWKDAAPMSGNTVSNGSGNVNGVNGVNNGTVKACGGPPCPKTEKPMGDIARELCEMIATQLEGKDMDIQIAVRAQVKAALDAALKKAKVVR